MEIVKHKFNLIESEELVQQIKRAKQNFFKNANKPGRWLSYRLKKEKQKRLITKLQDQNRDHQYKKEQIKKLKNIMLISMTLKKFILKR